jgi:hypothetical protein
MVLFDRINNIKSDHVADIIRDIVSNDTSQIHLAITELIDAFITLEGIPNSFSSLKGGTTRTKLNMVCRAHAYARSARDAITEIGVVLGDDFAKEDHGADLKLIISNILFNCHVQV